MLQCHGCRTVRVDSRRAGVVSSGKRTQPLTPQHLSPQEKRFRIVSIIIDKGIQRVQCIVKLILTDKYMYIFK